MDEGGGGAAEKRKVEPGAEVDRSAPLTGGRGVVLAWSRIVPAVTGRGVSPAECAAAAAPVASDCEGMAGVVDLLGGIARG